MFVYFSDTFNILFPSFASNVIFLLSVCFIFLLVCGPACLQLSVCLSHIVCPCFSLSIQIQHVTINTFFAIKKLAWRCYLPFSFIIFTMVLRLDGNSEIGAHVRNNLCYLICVRHLIRPEQAQKPILLSACAIYSELPSNISTMISTWWRVVIEWKYSAYCISHV